MFQAERNSLPFHGRFQKTENIDGVDYQVLVGMSLWTHIRHWREKVTDTAGRVEKFQSKFSRRGSAKGGPDLWGCNQANFLTLQSCLAL